MSLSTTMLCTRSSYTQCRYSVVCISVTLSAYTHAHIQWYMHARMHLQSHYSLATAQQAYKSLVKIHEKNGEMCVCGRAFTDWTCSMYSILYSIFKCTVMYSLCSKNVHECRASHPCVLFGLFIVSRVCDFPLTNLSQILTVGWYTPPKDEG